LQRLPDALAAFQRAATLDPSNPQFAVGAAVCAAMLGDAEKAEQQLRKITRHHPVYALAWLNLGNVLRQQGRFREAADIYRRVTRLDPAFADAYNNLGSVLHGESRYDEAEQAYREYLRLQPDAAVGYLNLASLLIDLGRTAEAVEVCDRGIGRLGESREFPELHWVRGSAFAHQGRFDAALAAFGTAVRLDPNHARAVTGFGLALLQSGNPQQGLHWLLRALTLESHAPEFRHAMAGVYLSLGDLQSGWREYQWRPARAWFLQHTPQLSLATELPAGLAGKRILLLREQGLGDELFFLRFAAELKSRGATITYRAHAKIASMLGRIVALDQVITENVPLPAVELAVMVGDLPELLAELPTSPYPTSSSGSDLDVPLDSGRGLPRLPKIFWPSPPPPLMLNPLPECLEAMKKRLSGLGPPPYLGLTWRAGTSPEQQRGSEWLLHKEIPLAQLGTTLRGIHGTLLGLQRNPRAGEIDLLTAHAARPVHDLTALNEDLEAMLALLALIDDYVGVSNTNMHLRAGVGRTARVLVPRPAEWRWMVSGRESPWFPGFRVYRQGVDGDWHAAFVRLSQEMREQFGPSL
jgi:tetratricopeptide (TPR) repeat protein